MIECRLSGLRAAAAALLAISAFMSGCADNLRPRKILERSAMEIDRSRTFIYTARAESRGALQGQLPTIAGDVRIVRLDKDDPLGAKVHAAGQVIAPTTGASVHFENAYDGRAFRTLRPGEEAIVEVTPQEGGRALFKDGADALI